MAEDPCIALETSDDDHEVDYNNNGHATYAALPAQAPNPQKKNTASRGHKPRRQLAPRLNAIAKHKWEILPFRNE